MALIVEQGRTRRVVGSMPLALGAIGLLLGGLAEGGLIALLCWVSATALVVVIGRFWRLSVRAGPESVRIVNWLRTVETPWSEVERFVLDADGALFLRRRDAREIPAYAFARDWRDVFHIALDASRAAHRRLERLRKQPQRALRRG